MTDAVTISLIGAVASFATAVLTLVNTSLIRRQERHLEEAKKSIAKVELHTNSLTEQLVKVTGEAEHAKGKKEGQESK